VRCTELDSECLGAHFARLLMHAFFTAFLARLPLVELDGPVQRLTSNFINGIKRAAPAGAGVRPPFPRR
jgi:hypothetical protein